MQGVLHMVLHRAVSPRNSVRAAGFSRYPVEPRPDLVDPGAVEDGEDVQGLGPRVPGGAVVCGAVVRVAEMDEELHHEVAAEFALDRHGMPAAIDRLAVPVEVVVGAAQRVPG